MGVLGAAGMELAPAGNTRERDLATGIVLGAGLGLAALLLELDVTHHSTTGAAVTVMFGSLFAIDPAIAPWRCWWVSPRSRPWRSCSARCC